MKDWKPIVLNDVEARCGIGALSLMPTYKEIPDEFKNNRSPWCKVVSRWFFEGISKSFFVPKEGIDKATALNHLAAIIRSWDPKHEHKEAAYLMSLWFIHPEDKAKEKAV